MTEPHDPRYPVGRFVPPDGITAEDRRYAVQVLAEMPELLREAVRGLDDKQFATPYRDGGWTVCQVVHHLADSHMTALWRIKKALTEDWPEIHGYKESSFAELADYSAPEEWSLDIIEGVHARWVMLLESLTEQQWKRGYRHNERGPQTIELATLMYAWHAQHHVAHITHLRTARGW